jgi:hypothetical protein
MPHQRPRGAILTLFSVIGIAYFGLLAVEYLLARLPSLGGLVSLPAGFGLDEFLIGIPSWASLTVTGTIWTGLLGAVLLAMRDRAAVPVLSVTLLGSLVALGWGALAYADGHTLIGNVQPLEMGASLATLTFGLWLYARSAKRNGALG